MANKEVEIHLTDKCPHDCVFCSVKKHPFPTPSLDEIKKDIIISSKIKKLILSGGEPFLRKDILKIIEFAKARNKYVIIETNLTLLNEKLLKRIIKARVNELKISFHSHEKKAYKKITKSNSFDKLLKNFELLKKYRNRIKISTNTVVTKYNYKTLNETVSFLAQNYSFLKEIRVSYPRFYPIKNCGKYSKKHLVPLNILKKKFKNMINKKKIIIENFPLCIINDERAKEINWDIWLAKKGKLLKGLEGRYFPKKCNKCKKKKECQGLHKYYTLYFDDNFVKPFR